jgi:hypothetical protein
LGGILQWEQREYNAKAPIFVCKTPGPVQMGLTPWLVSSNRFSVRSKCKKYVATLNVASTEKNENRSGFVQNCSV